MSDEDDKSEFVAATGDRDAAQGMHNPAGAIIQLWRAPNRIWPGFPTLVVGRAASRLGRGTDQDGSPAIGEGGVVSVFLDGSKVGAISPKEIKVYRVAPGEHSLSLRFLGGLRRSRKLSLSLAEGEGKRFVCSLNAFAWPSIRPATPQDDAAMEGGPSPAAGASDLV